MDWTFMEQLYLIFTRIFDGFINFITKAFGEDAE